MNVTLYYGYTKTDINNTLVTFTNITNSTQTQLYHISTNRSTNYYWRICANDNESHWENMTLEFTTEGLSLPIPQRNGLAIAALVFAMFSFTFVFILLRRKKR